MHTNVCTEELYLIEMCRAIGVHLPEDQLIFFFCLISSFINHVRVLYHVYNYETILKHFFRILCILNQQNR